MTKRQYKVEYTVTEVRHIYIDADNAADAEDQAIDAIDAIESTDKPLGERTELDISYVTAYPTDDE